MRSGGKESICNVRREFARSGGNDRGGVPGRAATRGAKKNRSPRLRFVKVFVRLNVR